MVGTNESESVSDLAIYSAEEVLKSKTPKYNNQVYRHAEKCRVVVVWYKKVLYNREISNKAGQKHEW